MANDLDFPGRLTSDLDELEAFDAMTLFLAAYWERGGRTSDDIAALLGSIERAGKMRPLDLAQWSDWLEAVDKVKGHRESR